MNEHLRSLYDNLVKDGYDLPDFDTFSSDMGDSTKAQKLYSTISKDGYDLPDFDTFHKDIHPQPKNGGVMDYVNAGVGALNRGIMQVVSSPFKMEGALEQSIGIKNPIQAVSEATGLTKESQPWALSAGQAIDKFTEKINPVYDNVNDTYQNVGQGIGQAAAMIGTAGLGAASEGIQATELATGLLPATTRAATEAGKRAISPTGMLGGSITAVPEWEAAKQAGLSDDEAFQTLVKNYLVGQTEAIPIQNMLGRLNRVTGGKILNTIRTMGIGALEEGTQEAVQTYLTNQIAKSDYDPDRDPLFQVLESGEVGGIVGFLLPGMVSLANVASADKKVKLDRKIGELQADKAIQEVGDTGNPALNAEIDAAAQIDPVDKQALEEIKVSEAVHEEQKSVEADEKIQEDLQPEPETETPKEVELKPSQTPEYKEAVDKVTKLKEQFEALDINENADQLLFDLREARQALQKIAGQPKTINKKSDIKTQIEDITGVTKPEKSIKMTPAEAIKHQVQTFYRGMEEGVRKGQKITNEQLVTKVQDAIKESPLTPQQVSAILTKVRKTNLFTPGSISKLNDFIDKTSTNAEYAQSVSEASSEQAQVKKKSKAKVNIPVNYKQVAKQFAKLDPTSVEDITEYRKIASEILGGFKDPKTTGYKAIDETKVQKYVDSESASQAKQQTERLKEQFGFEDFTDEEVERLLNSENLDEEEFYNKRQDVNRKTSRDKILKVANYSQMGLENNTEAPKALKEINLNRLSDGQLVEYVRTVDNIIQNDDYSNAAHIEAQAKAVNAAEEITSRITKNRGEIGKFKSAVYNVPMLFDAIYSDGKSAAIVQNYSGISDVYNGGSIVEGQEHQLYKDFMEKASEIKKKHGVKPLNADTQIRIGLFAPLVRYPKGADPDATLIKSKKIVETSIKRLLSKKSRKDLAQDAQRLYKPFKDAKTIAEVVSIMKRVDPGGYEMWQFFNKKFDDNVKTRLKETSEELYNQPFVEEENYTPKVMEVVDSGTSGALDESMGSAFHSDLPGAPKQAKTAISATNSLASGRALNFEFYNTMFRKYRESLYDIETSKPRLLFREFMRLPESTEILGGQENKNSIIETYKKSEEIQRGLGKDYSEAAKYLDEITGTLRTLGYTAALGSGDQFIKQYVPVAVNTMFNLGGDSGLFFSRIPVDADKLFEMYTIGQRGKRLGGAERGESTQYKIQSQYRNAFLKGINSIHKLTEKGSHIFMLSLTKGDVSVAKRSWTAYYLKSLKEAGIDLKTVDMATEHLLQGDKVRKEAASYAEHKVKTTQVVSNPSELGKLLRTSPGASSWIKNIFIPFSTFSVNTKARIIENFRQLRTAENKAEAYRALAGTTSEIVLYSTIKYFVLSQLYSLIKGGLENAWGLEPPEEKDDSDFKMKQWYSAIYKDFAPFAIGTAGETASVELANALSYISQNPNASYEDWKKETKGGTFYQYKDKSGAADLGLYSVGIKRVTDLVNDINTAYHIAKNEPAFVSTPWGEKELDLDPDQEKFVFFMTALDGLSSLGLMDAVVYNQARKIYKEQLKGTNSISSGNELQTIPIPKPIPRPIPLPRPIPR